MTDAIDPSAIGRDVAQSHVTRTYSAVEVDMATTSPDPIDIEVGARVRLRRKHLSMSQSALAAALGLTFQQVQKYERGSNRVSASMLVKIAVKLETTVGALIGENDSDRHSHEVYRKLAAPGALELFELYVAIQNRETRKAVVSLVRTLSI